MNLKVMKDFSEIVPYEIKNFPAHKSIGRLSYYSGMKALCHWHSDIEIMKALHGNFSYNVNGKNFFVREGDAIIVNSGQMHYGFSADGSDSEYLCVLFQPKIFSANDFIQTKYFEPIIHNTNLTETFLHKENFNHKKILQQIDKFLELPQVLNYELEFINFALEFWKSWLEILKSSSPIDLKSFDKNIDVQKNMLKFIYKNYYKKITLAEIAGAGNVCKSLCCQIFKKYLGKSPIDFLNNYRLQVGLSLLSDSKKSVMEISELCGFNSSSYFSEMFLKFKGCTPTAYRTKINNFQKNIVANTQSML